MKLLKINTVYVNIEQVTRVDYQENGQKVTPVPPQHGMLKPKIENIPASLTLYLSDGTKIDVLEGQEEVFAALQHYIYQLST